MKSVLIFGIGGFVGRYLAEEFHQNGYAVYGSDILLSPTLAAYVHYKACDLLSVEKVSALLMELKPTHIINLAAVSNVGFSWKQPQKTVAVNVEGTLNILEAARALDCMPKILLIGSSEEYAISGKPLNEDSDIAASNPYGLSKMMQEKFCEMYRQRYGMKIYHVRAFNHTGLGQSDKFIIPSWCKQAAAIEKSGKPGVMFVGNLEVSRDFSDVRDVVRAYRMVIESEDCTTAYNIGSGKALPLRTLLHDIISLSSQFIEVKVDEGLYRPADNPYICCDNSLIRERLGWRPEVPIEETIKGIFNDYLTH